MNHDRHIVILGIGGVTRDFAPNWPEPVLARALARRGYRVTAIGYHNPEHGAMAASHETIDGIEVYRIAPSIWPGPTLGRLLSQLPRPQVLQIYHFRNVMIANAMRWAQQQRIPVVHTPVGPFHDAYLVEDRERPYTSNIHYDRLAYDVPGLLRQLLRDPRPRKQLTNYLLHAPLRQIDRFIASSHHERELLIKMGFAPDRIEVIPLWIGPAPNVQPDTRILAKLTHPLVLFIGQLTPRKGFDLLVEAMPHVAREHPSATFVFVSHNPALQAQLEARASALGVAKQLVFAGRVSEAEKRALLDAAACLVIPSRYEGFGLPLLEAMQANVPLVATRIPVIDEIVSDNHDGLLVEYENPKALATAINRLLSDSDLRQRLISGGQAKLVTMFDEQQLLERVLQCYRHAGARLG
jgi:glycosyltransferase involved in cell wall biosynthesis